jgi:pullulanase
VLWDKLALSVSGASESEQKEMYKLALAIVLTSQGISFLHAGSEFLRTKKGNENSYNAGDSINAIDWDLKSTNNDIYQYVKALVKLRKEHPAFRMRTGEELRDNIRFLNSQAGVVAYTLNSKAVKDQWNKILVVYNSNARDVRITVPVGNWKKVLLTGQPGQNTTASTFVVAAARQCTIFYQ